MWQEAGNPQSDAAYEVMERTKHQYHYAVHRCKRNKLVIQKETIARNVNKSSGFCTELKKINPTSKAISISIGSANGSTEITKLLYDGVGTNLPIEEFKNILTHHLYPPINKPTREVKSSNTIINNNIFCNVPNALETCSVGIIRTYISDHHTIFCILDNVAPQYNEQNTIIKINLCDKILQHFLNIL